MKIVNLPDDRMETYFEKGGYAITIPDDGFYKLIGYETDRGSWVHKAYRPEPSKKTKKSKKKT